MSGCIHQAPVMYCGACAPEKLEKALDLLEQAQWAGSTEGNHCPWCGSWNGHSQKCPAALFMRWERD